MLAVMPRTLAHGRRRVGLLTRKAVLRMPTRRREKRDVVPTIIAEDFLGASGGKW